MSENRKKADVLVVAGAVLLLVLAGVGVYVGCYFGMSHTYYGSEEDGNEMKCWHVYDAQWKVYLFSPAAKVESLVTGREVSNHHDFGYGVHVIYP